MHQAAQSYAKTAKVTVSPRELEAGLLFKSARQLQDIQENWEEKSHLLKEALVYNRKLWTVLTQAMTREDCPLPDLIRQNILNLGIFIFKRTLETEIEKKPEQLTVLININREIGSGLQSKPEAKPAE